MARLLVNSAVEVCVGPIIDNVDLQTLETAIAYDDGTLSLTLFQGDINGLITTTTITPTTSGSNDWTHKAKARYSLELTAAQNDTVGWLQVCGTCDGCLPFESPVYEVSEIADVGALSSGLGAFTLTFTITDVSTTDPIQDVSVAVYDSTNTYMQAWGTTDANGQVALNLTAATYSIRLRKQGSYAADVKTLVVSATASQAYTMASCSPGAASVGLNTVYGYLLDTSGNAIASESNAVRVRPYEKGEFYTSSEGIIVRAPWTYYDTDANGLFECALIEGEKFEIDIPMAEKTWVITVPVGDTVFLGSITGII